MNTNIHTKKIEKLNNWFTGLIALPLLLVIYIYLELFSKKIKGIYSINNTILIITITILLLYTLFTVRSYKVHIKNIPVDEPLVAKISAYYRLSKLFFKKIFIISIITTLGLFITGNTIYAGFYAFLLFLLSIYKPSLLIIANMLRMKGKQRANFLKNNPASIPKKH